MFEDKSMNGPKKCHNCGSENIIGPYDLVKGRIFFGIFTSVGHQAYVCTDCFHSMLFIRTNDEAKLIKESKKHQIGYE